MSAIKSILLHLDAAPRCEIRLQATSRLAKQHDAEVMALYAAVPRSMQVPYAEGMSAQLLRELSAVDEARLSETRELFDKAVAGGLKRAAWLEPLEALSMRDFSRRALYADLVVVGQRERDDLADRGVPGDFVESVLIDSGKPVLVVPYIGIQGSIGRNVVVAWKETRETARAVAAALPILQRAEQVDIASWGDESDAAQAGIDELVAYLRRHGIEAALHRYGPEPGNIGGYILSAAADLNADLLVMGGYGHSRAREWVLGGATRTILDSMTVPVLMSH
jgi:nucleotide-binding universal stress UspA family protein